MSRVVKEDFQIISKAFKNQFKIPKFGDFCSIIKDIYEECKEIKDGNVASYIPQLASYDPNYWGVSICTVDGQRFLSQLIMSDNTKDCLDFPLVTSRLPSLCSPAPNLSPTLFV